MLIFPVKPNNIHSDTLQRGNISQSIDLDELYLMTISRSSKRKFVELKIAKYPLKCCLGDGVGGGGGAVKATGECAYIRTRSFLVRHSHPQSQAHSHPSP